MPQSTTIDSLDAKPKADVLFLLGLTLLAFLSRNYLLSDAYLVGDEVTTVETAAERVQSLVNPAYYSLVLLSFKFLGVSEFAARLPAMLLGVLSVPVFFVTWRNIIGRNAALIGSLLIIFSSWHLFYSQYARFYSGVFLFGSLTFYLFYQALLRDDLRRLAAALLAAGVGFLFHVTVAVALAGCAVFALLIVIRGSSAAQAGLSRRVATIYLALCALGALAAIPFLWDIWQGRQDRGVTWGSGPVKMVLQIAREAQLPIVVAALFGLAMMLRRKAWLGVYFLVGTALPVAFVVVAAGFLNSRSVYMFYALPLFIALAAVLCEKVRRAVVSDHPLSAHALTVLLLALMTPELLSHYTAKQSLDIRDAVAYIDREYRSDDVVVSFLREFDYYAQDKFPVVGDIGHTKVDANNPAENLDTIIAEQNRVWLVLVRGRNPLARDLEAWLAKHSRLVWRRWEKRLDYTFKTYEIYLVEPCTASTLPADPARQ